MFKATTHAIDVSVVPDYLESESDTKGRKFVWTYTIVISNQRSEAVQLRSRYWRIIDDDGNVREVEGEGVIGQQPVIEPGQSFEYTSSCVLETPSGIMAGQYRVELKDGSPMIVDIPAFSLDIPGAASVLH
ncbi:MAG: Co2+/Mg2+ efflux protein ApaG [Cohaesibacteraceae bacterium]|nr:Co2+/Mg2+ efflux protein ApaG [Cohaesibacteraceae bacterium]